MKAKYTVLILTLIFCLFQVSTGGVGWAADPIDWSKPYARMGVVTVGAGVAAGTTAYCTSATACANLVADNCDVLCEDGDAGGSGTDCDGAGAGTDANCWNGWAAVIDSGDSVDFTSAPASGYPCTGTSNTNVTQLTFSAANKATNINKVIENQTDLFTQFYWVGTSINNLNTSTGFARIFQVISSGSADIAILRLSGISGNYKLRLCVWNGSDITTACASSTANISQGTWYKVGIKLDQTNTTASLFVDGVEEVLSTYNDSSARTPYKVFFGQGGQNNTAALTWQVDNAAIDNDTMPSACK